MNGMGKTTNQVRNLLTEFEGFFFTKLNGKLNHTDLFDHNIDTGHENPIKYLLVDYLYFHIFDFFLETHYLIL